MALSVALALAVPAAADHCSTWVTDEPELDLTPLGAPYYVSIDPPCQPECFPMVGAVFLYEETNGIDGLQRFDEWFDGTCHGLIAPDTATEIVSG